MLFFFFVFVVVVLLAFVLALRGRAYDGVFAFFAFPVFFGFCHDDRRCCVVLLYACFPGPLSIVGSTCLVDLCLVCSAGVLLVCATRLRVLPDDAARRRPLPLVPGNVLVDEVSDVLDPLRFAAADDDARSSGARAGTRFCVAKNVVSTLGCTDLLKARPI